MQSVEKKESRKMQHMDQVEVFYEPTVSRALEQTPYL